MRDKKQQAFQEFWQRTWPQQLDFLRDYCDDVLTLTHQNPQGAEAVLTCLEHLMDRFAAPNHTPERPEEVLSWICHIPANLDEAQKMLTHVLTLKKPDMISIGTALTTIRDKQIQSWHKNRLSGLINKLEDYSSGRVMASLSEELQRDMFPTLKRSIQLYCLKNSPTFPDGHNMFIFNVCDQPAGRSLLCSLISELPPEDRKNILAYRDPTLQQSLATTLIKACPTEQISDVLSLLKGLNALDAAYVCGADKHMEEALAVHGIRMHVSFAFNECGGRSAPIARPAVRATVPSP